MMDFVSVSFFFFVFFASGPLTRSYWCIETVVSVV